MSPAVVTTCPYCGVGCGVKVWRQAGTLKVAGDEAHPANRGRLCVKGSALAETVADEGRLLQPMLRPSKGADAEAASWDAAMARVAQGFARSIAEHGPDSVAFYVSGQLLTEDYYVANKLMKGYLGSANIDTNSRLCMSSAVAGHKRAFGEDVVPVGYEDLESADLVVLAGSNLAWCHPVLYQRLAAAREQRPQQKVVVIDPRRTATCDLADLHLPIRPGSDVALFNGLLRYLQRQGGIRRDFVAAHTAGADAALAVAAAEGDLARVARVTGLSAETLQAFYGLFAERERTVTLFSQGVNQSSSGSDKVNAIINCHLLTGRIGRPGAGPFSITGQPNAMGGREVGGLANQLAAHLDIDRAEHRALVQRFWDSPTIAERPGLKAVDLFDAMHAGRIKAVWILATNPVVSLPDANRVREALSRCELVVVSEAVADTDTARLADVLLPAATWGERDGTVTNSERVISRQRPFRRAPGQARPDWWALCDLARRLGFGAHFDYSSPHQIFDEHARLSAYGNLPASVETSDCAASCCAGRTAAAPAADAAAADVATADAAGARGAPLRAGCGGGEGSGSEQDVAPVPRLFHIGGLAGLSAEAYGSLPPLRWPMPYPPGSAAARQRLQPFADGRFSHPDGRARLVPTPWRAPAHAPGGEHSLVLNTGRLRDQWHSMSRTGIAPTLAAHRAEPFVDLHAADALAAGVQPGALARVVTRWGTLVARVTSSGEMKRGEIFVPIHWNGANAADARVGALVNPAVDPLSGEPEFKHTPARVEPFAAGWYGFAFSRVPLTMAGVPWWVRVQGAGFLRYEMAGLKAPKDPALWARELLGAVDGDDEALAGEDADWLELSDPAHGSYRAVWLQQGRIQACLYLGPRPDLPARHWLAEQFGRPRIDGRARIALLAGVPPQQADTGPTVCACFGVGRNTLVDAIAKRRLCSTAEVTASLKAGGNCGSCLPEIRALVADVAETAAR